jgi:hypothetical protein
MTAPEARASQKPNAETGFAVRESATQRTTAEVNGMTNAKK